MRKETYKQLQEQGFYFIGRELNTLTLGWQRLTPGIVHTERLTINTLTGKYESTYPLSEEVESILNNNA